MKTQILSSVALGSALLLGCSSDPKPPPVAPGPTTNNDAAQRERPSADEATRSSIVIDPKILELCDIPTAHFSFDSSALSKDAQGALTALATCFTNGNAKGKGLLVVGHADPRGETEYNFALGQRRAGAVAEYLMRHGVSSDRVQSSSRGELDASGFNKQTWALDRNVAITLADEGGGAS